MFTAFSWRGEPIPDINVWARGRGEKMVTYHAERKVPNPYTGRIDIETQDGAMPASFYDNLRMSDGWFYTELSREEA